MTTLDFINGVNLSGLNKKDSTQLADNSALFGAELTRYPRQSDLTAVPDRVRGRAKSRSQQSSDIVVGHRRSGFAASEDRLQYFGLYEAGYRRCVSPEELIFNKLGAEDFTKTADSDPAGFDQ